MPIAPFIMNRTQIEGRWHTLAGQLKSQWGKLTDDDLKVIAGKREQLLVKLQERYGLVKDDAARQIDTWLTKLMPEVRDEPSTHAGPVKH